MVTNAELSSQFSALQKQMSKLMGMMSTKEDIAKLATKEELQKQFDDFKAEIRQEIDERFAAYKQEQATVIDELRSRVLKAEGKLENRIAELDAQRLMDLKFSYRINSLLIGVPEKQGTWKETPKDCRDHVQKYLNIILPDPSQVEITDCHRLGSTKPNDGDLTARGEQKARPIIFKVKNFFQIRTIRDNLEKFKPYFDENPNEKRVFIRPHIPRSMFLQRSKLQPKFQELYDAGQQPKWVLDKKTAKYRIAVKNADRSLESDEQTI